MILNEIGLELEMFLLDREGNILEPSKYGFPADEMGFLIELRTEHSDNPEDIMNSLLLLSDINIKKSQKLEFEIKILPYLEVTQEFQEYISEKYKHSMLPDHTKNIYGIKKTHHTGFHDNLATAGLHVHFSSRRIFGNKCLQRDLPIERIVTIMDNTFSKEIKDSKRIEGEYEMKAHGFEYRSLPASIDYKTVIQKSLEILNEVK